MFRLFLFSLFLFFTSHSYSAREFEKIDWKQIQDKNGVKVYKPIDYKHSTGLVPIRFVAIINHNISKILTVLDNTADKLSWMPNLKEVFDYKVIDFKEKIVYYRYNTPWPFQDRDFLISSKGEFKKEKNEVYVVVKSVNFAELPKVKNVIRAKAYESFSRIKMISPKETLLEMVFLNDFKGNLPNFIVNYVQAKWPNQFVNRLKKKLETGKIVINKNFTL